MYALPCTRCLAQPNPPLRSRPGVAHVADFLVLFSRRRRRATSARHAIRRHFHGATRTSPIGITRTGSQAQVGLVVYTRRPSSPQAQVSGVMPITERCASPECAASLLAITSTTVQCPARPTITWRPQARRHKHGRRSTETYRTSITVRTSSAGFQTG